MHCKTCNTEITNEGRIGKIAYCPECGSLLASVCRKCGKELRDGDKFCYFCGEPVEEPEVDAPQNTVEIKEIYPADDDANSDGEATAEEGKEAPTDDVPY